MAKKYRWAALGDINAFFGLMLDNVAGLILLVSLLHLTAGFPVEFTLRYMVPGTAIGVLIGDLAFFFIAFRLAKSTGRDTVTAMPLGLDTPSTFGMVLFVLGPAFRSALPEGGTDDPVLIQAAAMQTWHIGIWSIFVSGLLKIICAFGSGWIRSVVPRAGLLGSLAAIALVLISFQPLLEILRIPLVGLVSLSLVLTALIGRTPLPFKLPGAVIGLVVGGTMFALMNTMGYLGESQEALFDPAQGLLPTEWMQAFSFGWWGSFGASIQYLPIVLPFALATVVGGIDCTESAAAAGDEFDTNRVIGVEAIATLLASLCGAVIQTTPYIGHPAYKAMGGRAAYTLATAVTIGILGTTGLFGYFYQIVPKATVFPILVFIGLEITAQSFLATPRRHYPAVAIACIPALATLLTITVGQIWGDGALIAAGINPGSLQNPELQANLDTIMILSNGFILTSVFWASALAMAIDRRLVAAAKFFFGAAICTLFGLIHSPLPTAPILAPFPLPFLPDSAVLLDPELRTTVFNWTLGYIVVGLLMLLWNVYLASTDQLRSEPHELDSDDAV
jgi:AGZA family xanthine/uracil permease-like MFS transporter